MPTLKWLLNEGNYYYFKDAPVHISSITLNKSSISLTSAGQTEQLTATISPDDAVEKHVRWSSSDITIATVSQTGLVTCIAPGSCTITAECSGITATCEVSGDIVIDLLVVAGGGGGGVIEGIYQGAGGGAGGVIIRNCETINNQEYSVIVGAGGAAGNRGGDSCFGDFKVYGGGNGGSYGGGGNGGSGGGGSGGYGGNGGSSIGYTGYEYLGNNGGNGANCSAGGGGGAGGAGCNASNCYGGTGGIGITTDIVGSEICIAGGGGGRGCYGAGSGSYGGGGNGQDATTCGSGGGPRAKGGGGLVVVRYLTSCGYNISGGCKYTCGDYTIHCFTSDGTFCIIG